VGCEWVVSRGLFFIEGVGKSEINIASSLVLSFFTLKKSSLIKEVKVEKRKGK
jgi:hypothetical protein